MPAKIAYLMSRFPHLPETFILREMTELSNRGRQICLYPLILQDQPVIHPQAQKWLEGLDRTPLISANVLMASLQMLIHRPGVVLRAAIHALLGNIRSPRFLARTAALLPKALYLSRQLERLGVEHIHAHYATHPALVAWIIHRLTGISYSVTAHAHDIFVTQPMLDFKMRDAQFIVAISEFNRRYLSDRLGSWILPKTHVIHCGIDPALYTPRGEKRSGRKKFEILNIGSLQPYKGHIYLIEACAILKERGIPFRCCIIGGGDQRELTSLIGRYNLDRRVELLGPQDESFVAKRLAEADCYVQPSVITPSGKMEGIPVSIMEALACECPVVTTEISGIPELVQPGKTGYLVPPADSLALADALEYVFSHPVEAGSLASAGRRLVIDEYNLHVNVQRLDDLFNQTIETQSKTAGQRALAATLQ